jgi:hypothetical protein
MIIIIVNNYCELIETSFLPQKNWFAKIHEDTACNENTIRFQLFSSIVVRLKPPPLRAILCASPTSMHY